MQAGCLTGWEISSRRQRLSGSMHAVQGNDHEMYSWGNDLEAPQERIIYLRIVVWIWSKLANMNPTLEGFYDMHGNVWEWTADRYGEYNAFTVIDPVGSVTGKTRVFRGGAGNEYAHDMRSANRISFTSFWIALWQPQNWLSHEFPIRSA